MVAVKKMRGGAGALPRLMPGLCRGRARAKPFRSKFILGGRDRFGEFTPANVPLLGCDCRADLNVCAVDGAGNRGLLASLPVEQRQHRLVSGIQNIKLVAHD